MTNQASEELERGIETSILLRTKIRNTLHNNEIGFSMAKAGNKTAEQMAEELVEQLAGHCESIIRTEKLKLLAEVRERVVGEDESLTGYELNPTKAISLSARNKQRAEQRAELTKMEAEL